MLGSQHYYHFLASNQIPICPQTSSSSNLAPKQLYSQMPVATEKSGEEPRSILAPTGNRVRVFENQRRKKEATITNKPKKVISQSPAKLGAAAAAAAVMRCNVSADSSSDSSSSAASSSSGSNVKSAKSIGSGGIKKSYSVVKSAKIVSRRVESLTLTPAAPLPIKRCDWITPNSESLYTSFHDEEWGVPIHDDIKLFELLVLSQALAELAWPMILSKRSVFRKLFEEFDPTLVGNLDAEKLLSMRVQGGTLLSEPKLRSIIENAKPVLKIQQEFGSFSNYCWGFVNHKPIKSGFRHGRQVPAKTPKSELISKDLMQRGFRCIGPTVVYSFMQVAGLVNDHLVSCFRYNECGHSTEKEPGSKPDRTAQLLSMEIKTSTSDELDS